MPAEVYLNRERLIDNIWEDDDFLIRLGPVIANSAITFTREDIGIKGITAKVSLSEFAGQYTAEVTIGTGIVQDPAQSPDVWWKKVKHSGSSLDTQSAVGYIKGGVEETIRWHIALLVTRNRSV